MSALVDVGLIIADESALDMYTVIYFLVLPYALFRWASGREVLAGLAIILVAATAGFFLSWTGFGDLIGGTAVLMTSMALGATARSQHDHRRRRLEQAKAEERVGWRASCTTPSPITSPRSRSRPRPGEPSRRAVLAASVEALEVIEAEASRALDEMRAMVRVLRNQEPADYAPQPGVADLERLAGAPATGPRVEVQRSGDLAPPRRRWTPRSSDRPGGGDQRAAPCPQRDAGRGRCRGWSLSIRLSVHDDGEPVRVGPPAGFGLLGMVERATLLGGACSAGPDPTGLAGRGTLPREVAG